MPADERDESRPDLIGQDARVRRISRMIPARGPLSGKMRDDILYALQTYVRETGLSQADVAKAIGTSVTYINNLGIGRRANSPPLDPSALPDATRDELLRDGNNWLDREARAREQRRPALFVEHIVTQEMFRFAQELTQRAELGYVDGPAGIGKTITAQAIAAELGAVYVFVDDDCLSPCGLRDKLYNTLARRKRVKRAKVADVVDKLRMPERVATCNLVILDEAHDLRDGSFKMMRKIAEQARCSVLYVGTVEIGQRLLADDNPEHGQLASRVGLCLHLAELLTRQVPGGRPAERVFTVDDVRAMFGRDKIKLHPSTVRFLASLANLMTGHLRDVERLCFYAQRAASRKRAERVMPEHIESAAKFCDKKLPIHAADIYRDAGESPAELAAAETAR